MIILTPEGQRGPYGGVRIGDFKLVYECPFRTQRRRCRHVRCLPSSAQKKGENPFQCKEEGREPIPVSEEGREPVPVHRRRERTRPHAQKDREPMQCSSRVV